ncbi:MAG: fructosamine kinase family protein [Flavobacteriaceae bacterium]|nr:fructosamine kinase family protein [Flavobacteriaceae bacterium]
MNTLIQHISQLLDEPIKDYRPVSGGDISQAFLLETTNRRCFLKVNSDKNAFEMFASERSGLEALATTKTIATPSVFHSGKIGHMTFLLMEYIESKPATSQDFEKLGRELATLHKNTSTQFGFETDNFIGSLPQQNNHHDTWVDFYSEERLIPQLELAVSKNLMSQSELPDKELMKSALTGMFENIEPSLLHGDLWGGNFLISLDGTPYLIDPAVYYGHHEVDIAMSRLFGGFGASFYAAYHEEFPIVSETPARIEMYQLYYLLVHLNIFGSSYSGSVKRILKRYF